MLLSRGRWKESLRHDPGLLRHEERHAWQRLLCAGLPFLPLYGASALASSLVAGDGSRGDPFERWAGLEDGGYRPRS